MLAVLATAFVAVGVTAYAGALPTRMQQAAHTLIGAPAPAKTHGKHAPKQHPKRPEKHAPKHTPVGPDANGPAKYGLCNAYRHSHVHGNSMGHSIAMRNLAQAAGGAASIPGFCARVSHPGGSHHGGSHPSAPGRGPRPEPSETETD